MRDRTVELTRSNELLHKEILERTRAENALRASEQQYRLLAENVKDGIMIVQKNTIVFANSVLTTMLGISSEEYGETIPVSAYVSFPRPATHAAVCSAKAPQRNPIPNGMSNS